MKTIILAFGILVLYSLQAFSQSRSVEGLVTDIMTSEPLIGVAVALPNNSHGVVTDVDGRYKIMMKDADKMLKFSYVGYRDSLIVVKPTQNVLDVKLRASVYSLVDVVVVGYTSQSKNKLTGSISLIEGVDINSAPVASLDQSLQGRVPGLYVASPSGLPGTPGRVTIRGIGSLQGANTNPLYIIDGVPVDPNSFAALNPEDFETYSVLKDAASAAQYGSRAANGVIVITTKSGKSYENGRARIQYSSQFGVSSAKDRKWNMMNTNQRLQFEEILQDVSFPGWQYSRKNPYNSDGTFKTEADYLFGDNYLNDLRKIDNNLSNKILRTAFNQSHNLSLSGGNNKTSYYLSGSYFQQDGVLHNSGLKRYNLRSNVLYNNGPLRVGVNIGLGYSDAKVTEGDFDVSETNPVAAMYLSLPYEKIYNEDGSLATGTNKYGANALSMFKDMERKEAQIKSIASLNLSYRLSDYLKLTGTVGIDFQQFHNTHFTRPDSYLGSLVDPGGAGSFQDQYLNRVGFVTTGGAVFNHSWGAHDVEFNLLGEYNQNRFNASGFVGYGLIPGIENTPAGIGQTSLSPLVNGQRSRNALLSQIGLFRYTYSNKYTFTGSLRRDGSSRAPKANRYKIFYAFGGSWDVLREDFMENNRLLSTLKARVSYGRMGNASGFASDFGYRGLFGASSYGGNSALVPIAPSNPNYNWELNYIGDLGVDLGLFNDRLRVGFDLYNRITSDLFVEKQLSYTSGFSSISTNAGKIRNRGIELYVEGELMRTKDWKLTAGINLAYNKNRILSLGDEDEFVTEDYSINRVGRALGQFYMVRWAGVDAQTGAPQYLDADGNITNTFNPDDAVPVKGSFDPPLKGGFTLNVEYKNLELSSLFTFINGMYRLNTAELFRTSADANYRQYNQSADMLNIWQKPGDITEHPAAAYPRYMTDRELQRADYLKLRNVRLSYKVPLGPSIKKHIQGLNLFAQGQNLLTWTSFKAFDPEDDNNWYQYEYPLARTVTAGFNLSF